MNRRSFLKLAGIGVIAPFVPLGLQQLYEPVCAPIEITQTKTDPQMVNSIATFRVVKSDGTEDEISALFYTEHGKMLELPIPDWWHKEYSSIYLTKLVTYTATLSGSDFWTIEVGR